MTTPHPRLLPQRFSTTLRRFHSRRDSLNDAIRPVLGLRRPPIPTPSPPAADAYSEKEIQYKAGNRYIPPTSPSVPSLTSPLWPFALLIVRTHPPPSPFFTSNSPPRPTLSPPTLAPRRRHAISTPINLDVISASHRHTLTSNFRRRRASTRTRDCDCPTATVVVPPSPRPQVKPHHPFELSSPHHAAAVLGTDDAEIVTLARKAALEIKMKIDSARVASIQAREAPRREKRGLKGGGGRIERRG
ncbi:hypothetical protein R3P38DRAFT_3229528 [Favolaschia claudopus]|uniref:Uncharacterized protein n=1 Tax=Favolaschia claudopus TaxID=2862362 RepID=A0AAV9ZNA4_9AGAR